MQRIKRTNYFIATAIISLTSLLTIGLSSAAHAASCTWTGGGSDSKFSTAANWSGCSGSGGVPGNGDSLTFDTTASGTPTNDISGLSVSSITFNNSSTPQIFIVKTTVPMTIGGTINTGTKGDTLALDTDGAGITLGSDVSVTGSGFLTFDSYSGTYSGSETLNLNGHALSFNVTNATAGVDIIITGNGTVNANTTGIINALRLNAANTYAGATNIKGAVTTKTATPFGTSDVNITTTGSVDFNNKADATISNKITMAGSKTISGLQFSGNPTSIKYTIPNIVLNGNVRFANYVKSVNMTGIKANGHCATYFGSGSSDITNGPAHGFTGGPTGCIYSSTGGDGLVGAPGVPNTGIALIKANPAITAAIALISAATIMFVAKKVKPATERS